MEKILGHFSGGSSSARGKLNDIVQRLNSLQNIVGDEFIRVQQAPSGFSLHLSVDILAPRIAKQIGGGDSDISGTVIRSIIRDDPLNTEYPQGINYYVVRLSNATVPDGWDYVKEYVPGDKVTYLDNYIYEATQLAETQLNKNKPPTPEYIALGWWVLDNETQISKSIGMEDSDLRECFPWFVAGVTVPIIQMSGVYYFNATLPTGGPIETASILWNDTLKKVQVVLA